MKRQSQIQLDKMMLKNKTKQEVTITSYKTIVMYIVFNGLDKEIIGTEQDVQK